MACVYWRLGEKALVAIHNINCSYNIVDVAKWEDMKRLRVHAFDRCETPSSIYTHLSELIQQDRVLRKIARILPNIMPWSDCGRYFPVRVKRVTTERIQRLAKTYQPDYDEAMRNKIYQVMSADMSSDEEKRGKAAKLKWKAVSDR